MWNILKAKNELIYKTGIKLGTKGKDVKKVQEWLCFHGIGLVTDGDFGRATKYALSEFQENNNLDATGRLNQATFNLLIEPAVKAFNIPSSRASLQSTVARIANQHCKLKPREIGGDNKGPWVRLYMDNHEGRDYPWCAGFVSKIVMQACKSKEAPLPIKQTYSCDVLAMDAKNKSRFISESKIRKDKSLVKPGMIFLYRKSSNDWIHTGIVKKAYEKVFISIEGNTNDGGDREGREVLTRVRGYKRKDFILLN